MFLGMGDCDVDEYVDSLYQELLERRETMIDIKTKRLILAAIGEDITYIPNFKRKVDSCTLVPHMSLDQAMTEIQEGTIFLEPNMGLGP